MPKETFFRLPEEKRERIMDAARKEFIKTPYKDLSINQIIKAAEIPRGSFYQYFTDKDDMFLYMIQEKKDQFVQFVRRNLEQEQGDFMGMILKFIERGRQFVNTCDSCNPIPSLSDQQSLRVLIRVVDNDKVFVHLEQNLKKLLLEKGDFSNIRVDDTERETYIDIIENVCGGCLKKVIQSKDKETRLKAFDKLKAELLLVDKAFRQKDL